MKSVITTFVVAALSLAASKAETAASTPPAAAASPAIAPRTKPYPLDTCLVSGEKLGKMGKPFEIVHEGQQIKFCCKSCAPKFAKDPAKYLSKLK
jgi:YHS domain-containing protein